MPWGVPTEGSRADGGLLSSPFMDEPLAGYELWKPYDRLGAWYKMLQPNAHGAGVHVGQVIEPECCVGYYGARAQTVARSAEDTPWLLPSAVTWFSIMGEDGTPLEPFKDWFSVDYPCVAIATVDSAHSEFRWWLDNVNVEFNCERWDYEPMDNAIHFEGLPFELIGIVPIWTVMPLSEKYLPDLKKSIAMISANTGLELLGECWCTIEYIECEENCPHEKQYTNECTCDSRGKVLEQLEALWTETIDPRTYMTEICTEIYTEAIDNFYSGWKVVYDAKEQGEQWAYYWWQQQSPFWGSPGQNAKMTSEWTDSINSVTQQAS